MSGRLAPARPCKVIYRRTSLISSCLLFQQCPTCLVRLIWIVLEMGGRWPYSCCFVACCFQDLFNIARRIIVQLLSSFFSIRLVSVHVVHPYSSMDTTAALKKLRFIATDRSDFHWTDNLSIVYHTLASRVLMSFYVNETQLPMWVNLSTSFKEPPFSIEMCPRGVMVKAMNCVIVVREFVLQSRYYVHFWANTLGKGMNPLILPPAMGK